MERYKKGDLFNFRSMIATIVLKVLSAVLFFDVIALGTYLYVNPPKDTPQWVRGLVIIFG